MLLKLCVISYIMHITIHTQPIKSNKEYEDFPGIFGRNRSMAQLVCFMFNNQKLTGEDCHTFHIFLPYFLKSEEG